MEEHKRAGGETTLPSGLVTFVFTDIEASTRLYRSHPDEVDAIFDLHNEIMRSAWNDGDGYEIHTEGDSFFVAFETTDEAINACLLAQLRLDEAAWPGGAKVRVRIGIHAGLGAPRHGDYMSLAVHQAARVMHAAQGGQILITESTLERSTSRDAACGAFQSVLVGAFRLRDFDEPPQLFRLDHQALTPVDRAPRSAPATGHNLVRSLTSFVGRTFDLTVVHGLVAKRTAVTLVGPGGVGKTRLAIEAAHEQVGKWPDGVWFVELAEVADAELIDEAIANVIGAAASPDVERWHDLQDHIGDKSMLLVIDNIEHHLDVCAARLPTLLRSCPNLAIITTSREPMNVEGEQVYRVAPLDNGGDSTGATETDAEKPTVRLFVDRANSVRRGLRWSDVELALAGEICDLVDGLPLAIEIAAAQLGVQQIEELLQGLRDQSQPLLSRDRTRPARQRTLDGLLDWSHQLLSPAEQAGWLRLAVFGGTFSMDGAIAVVGGDRAGIGQGAELLWALVDKSLVVLDGGSMKSRYRLLGPIRRFALERLVDSGSSTAAASAAAEWLVQRIGPGQLADRRWLNEVELELPNIRSVVEMIAATEPEKAQALMCSVGRFHDARQAFGPGIEELTLAVERLSAPTPARVTLLTTLADLHLRQASTDQAEALLVLARSLAADVGTPAWSHAALERTEGELALRAGDYQQAIALATSTLNDDVGDRGAARLWNLIGLAHHMADQPVEAIAAFANELEIYEALQLDTLVAGAHANVAEQAWQLGDHDRSAFHQQASLRGAIEAGQPVLVAYSMIAAARFDLAAGLHESALSLLVGAEVLLSEAGHELYASDQAEVRTLQIEAEAALGAARASEVSALVVEQDLGTAASHASTALDNALARREITH